MKLKVGIFVLTIFCLFGQPSNAAEAVCREVYTEGIGWTNTFGIGRCPGSEEEELGRLAVGVAGALAVYWLIGGFDGDETQKMWRLEESRSAVFGFPISTAHGFISVKAFSFGTTIKESSSQQQFMSPVRQNANPNFNLMKIDWAW